jgi:O-methyltransferase involved in polyketide biosynthesis
MTGDLSVTALYTAGAWSWAAFPNAELFASVDAARVFRVVNAALAVARFLRLRAAPLAPSLVHRHGAIDHLLAQSGCRDVVELAAGLSRRGATFSTDPAIRYVEVDLPHVVAAKRALLERTREGQAALARTNWSLVGADVTALSLDAVAPPDRSRPLFVIAEGLMMYLGAEAQRALMRSVAARLAAGGGGTFVFDLVPAREQPRPGAVGRMLEWLMKRFTGGKSFVRDTRTRDDVASEARACGFRDVTMVEPAAVARAWGLPLAEAPSQQLLFVAS